MSVIAFHEKASPGQVLFLLLSSFLAERCSERPGAVKGAFCAAQRTLDGEDRSASIPPRRKKAGFWPQRVRFSKKPESQTVATLPSALLCERFLRSVQVGCSRFSRRCHLFADLRSIPRWKLGQAISAVTGTRRLGFVFPIFSIDLSYAAAGMMA